MVDVQVNRNANKQFTEEYYKTLDKLVLDLNEKYECFFGVHFYVSEKHPDSKESKNNSSSISARKSGLVGFVGDAVMGSPVVMYCSSEHKDKYLGFSFSDKDVNFLKEDVVKSVSDFAEKQGYKINIFEK